jgi:hypothetical protein
VIIAADDSISTPTSEIHPLITPKPNVSESGGKQKCLNSWLSYFDERVRLVSEFEAARMTSSPYTLYHTQGGLFETIKTIGKGNSTTLCDGITRFRFTENPSYYRSRRFEVSVTRTYTYSDRLEAGARYPRPKLPECDLEQKQCDNLWATFNAEVKAHKGGRSSRNEFTDFAFNPWEVCPVKLPCIHSAINLGHLERSN